VEVSYKNCEAYQEIPYTAMDMLKLWAKAMI
jgi:hypothetical protein